jgi:hypothetical protein
VVSVSTTWRALISWLLPERRVAAAEVARLSRHLAALPLDGQHRATLLRFAAVWNLRAGNLKVAAAMLATLAAATGAAAVGPGTYCSPRHKMPLNKKNRLQNACQSVRDGSSLEHVRKVLVELLLLSGAGVHSALWLASTAACVLVMRDDVAVSTWLTLSAGNRRGGVSRSCGVATAMRGGGGCGGILWGHGQWCGRLRAGGGTSGVRVCGDAEINSSARDRWRRRAPDVRDVRRGSRGGRAGLCLCCLRRATSGRQLNGNEWKHGRDSSLFEIDSNRPRSARPSGRQ